MIKQLLGIKLEVASWEKSTKLYKVSQKDVGRWDTMLENVRWTTLEGSMKVNYLNWMLATYHEIIGSGGSNA